MSRELLLERLEALDPINTASCFVLLWSYLNGGTLASGESLGRSRGIHPRNIEPLHSSAGTPEELRSSLRSLQGMQDAAFNLAAIAWIRALDLALRRRSAFAHPLPTIPGLDGNRYHLRPRNGYLADQLGRRITWEKDQSASRHLHTPFHFAIPETCDGRTIAVRPETSWLPRVLRRRLALARSDLTLLLWPLRTVLDYLDRSVDPQFVRYQALRNESAVRADLEEALDTARRIRATVLVLPELAVAPETLKSLRAQLSAYQQEGHPFFTIAGLCHRPAEDPDLDVNEAVLLGPDGTELHRHRKMTSFTFYSADRASSRAEQLLVGQCLTILECCLGNLSLLICLDLIHPPLSQVIRTSHANLLFVPSLSPSTAPHRTAAKQFLASQLASTFVSNRTLEGATAQAPSFFQVPKKGGYTPHDPALGTGLVFRLRDHLDKQANDK